MHKKCITCILSFFLEQVSREFNINSFIASIARVKKRVSPVVMHIIRSETLGETLGGIVGKSFRAKQSRRESRIGLYA